MKSSPLMQAIALLGSAATLARALKVSPSAVHEWAAGRRPLPIERCVQVEQITSGAVTRMDLRPDDWWQIWPELAERHPERIPDRPPSDEPEPDPRGPNPTKSGCGHSPGMEPSGAPEKATA